VSTSTDTRPPDLEPPATPSGSYTTGTFADRVRVEVRKVLRNARDKNKWRKVVRFRLWMPVVLQLLLIVAVAWYTTTRFEGFINASNVTNILILAAPLAMVAIGQTHALLVGYLDLSVGAMVTFGVIVASFLMPADATTAQLALGVGAVFVAALGLGLVNAGLAVGLKIPSIIATLATLSVLNGVSLTLRETPGGIINRDFTEALRTDVGAIPVVFLVCVIAAAALDYWLHATGSGLQLRATGFDDVAAKRNGVRTKWVRTRALVLSAMFAAVASFFVMARSGIGNASIGESYALNSITAAVLGGAALAGGRATFLGALVASVLLALIISALPFLGLAAEHGQMIIGVLVLLGIVLFQVGDMKELVKRNYKRARRLVIGSRPPQRAEIPALYAPGTDFRVVPTGRKVIRGGTVLSMDPGVGEIADADVVIEDDRIVEVRRNVGDVADAEVIDATGMIVMPGFIDTHRHIWEGLLRNIGTDVPLEGRSSYISYVLHKLAPAYRPEDAYIGDLISALGAIDAGITTLLDWSHIQGSPAHTDAVVQALKDSGMRAVFAYGFPWWGKWEERQPSWFVRAANEHFTSRDGMLSLALAAPGPEFTDFEISRDHWKLAREAGARITTHVGVGSYGLDGKVQEMGEAGLLGPDTTYIHCTTLNDTEISMIVDSGGTVSLAAPVEMMMGHGMPPIQKFLDRGLRPSLSVDVETNVPSDMFNQMRSVLALQRAVATAQDKPTMTPRDVLRCATIDGARANGLDDRTGSLTPGKQADIVVVEARSLNMAPVVDPVAAVVLSADVSNVDTVLVAGQFRKRDGRLVADAEAARATVEASSAHLLEAAAVKQPA